MSRKPGSTLLVHGALIAGAVATLTPLVWMVSASFMPEGEANSLVPHFLPSRVTLAHYITLFSRLDLGRHLMASLLVSGAATLSSVLFNAMAGYAFGKLRFPGRERIFKGLLLMLSIPSQVAVLPLFLLLKSMGFVNTYWGVVIPSMSSIFGIFLVRQYVRSIPDDLLDAARIDGAGELRIFWSIVLPVCRPVLATLAIFTFMGTWNDFMWPLVILTDASKYTLPVALANLSGEHVQDTELMMAGSVLTILPVLLLFLALQRVYVEGIVAGGVKE